MAAFLLVHSPFLGPGSWARVAAELRRCGHDAAVPDLRGAFGAPPYHDALVRAAVAGVDADRVLVVHSNAGRLLGALAGALGGRYAGAVLVDALFPAPGTRWVDRAPTALVADLLARTDDGGLLPPWPRWWPDDVLAELVPDAVARAALDAEAPPVPRAYLEELAPDGSLAGPVAYLRLSAGYAAEADQAAALGGPVVRRDLHHLATVTHPALVATDVGRLADALTCSRRVVFGRIG